VLVPLAAALLVPISHDRSSKPPKPEEYFGVNAQFLFTSLLAPAWPRHLEAMRKDGIRVVRYDALWEHAEPSPPVGGTHRYDWVRFDLVAAALARARLRWEPIIDYSAPWAGVVKGARTSAPRSQRDFAAYARAFAERYGKGGEFWRAHPELPSLPVKTYEIWNEPNYLWQPRPDPAAYADLYLSSRRAILSADSDAQVIVGGLTTRGTRFLRSMYKVRPQLRGQVDAVGFHPYGFPRDPVEAVLHRVGTLRRVLDSVGERTVPIEITEIGWTTSGAYGAISDRQRAANFRRLLERLTHSRCRVRRVIAHTWMTAEGDPRDREQWFGLYHPNASPTLAGRAYGESIHELDRDDSADLDGLSGTPCGR
jgi:hypothetical protein